MLTDPTLQILPLFTTSYSLFYVKIVAEEEYFESTLHIHSLVSFIKQEKHEFAKISVIVSRSQTTHLSASETVQVLHHDLSANAGCYESHVLLSQVLRDLLRLHNRFREHLL